MDAVKRRAASRLKLTVNYDRRGDVLYLAVGAPVPAWVDEGDDGLAYRFAYADDRPCGVTVVGFRHAHWPQRLDELSAMVAGRLPVRQESVHKALASVAA